VTAAATVLTLLVSGGVAIALDYRNRRIDRERLSIGKNYRNLEGDRQTLLIGKNYRFLETDSRFL
jgi:hypothetical protein